MIKEWLSEFSVAVFEVRQGNTFFQGRDELPYFLQLFTHGYVQIMV